ncbi:MAG TPA: DUF2071 domain-containing protein [Acidobacteriaceae bacterium]
MKQPGRFLTAEWKNLLMLNYAVDPSLLNGYVPAGTELDSFAGKTYLSLVAFEFNRTCVLGVAVPFHRSFEEVNLRFYVRRGERRGVVFIRELVPKFAVAWLARTAFGENYASVPMSHRIEVGAEAGTIRAEYAWGAGADSCTASIETHAESFVPGENSLAQFITEHYWGYAEQRNGGSLEYEVKHPPWQVREGRRAEFHGNTARYYGDSFAQLLKEPAESAFLAEGSAVTVFKGVRIA